jgi:hypothetical protein
MDLNVYVLANITYLFVGKKTYLSFKVTFLLLSNSFVNVYNQNKIK